MAFVSYPNMLKVYPEQLSDVCENRRHDDI